MTVDVVLCAEPVQRVGGSAALNRQRDGLYPQHLLRRGRSNQYVAFLLLATGNDEVQLSSPAVERVPIKSSDGLFLYYIYTHY